MLRLTFSDTGTGKQKWGRWQATCPFHRKLNRQGKSTQCTRTVYLTGEDDHENAKLLCMHWCLLAQAFKRKSTHMTAAKRNTVRLADILPEVAMTAQAELIDHPGEVVPDDDIFSPAAAAFEAGEEEEKEKEKAEAAAPAMPADSAPAAAAPVAAAAAAPDEPEPTSGSSSSAGNSASSAAAASSSDNASNSSSGGSSSD